MLFVIESCIFILFNLGGLSVILVSWFLCCIIVIVSCWVIFGVCFVVIGVCKVIVWSWFLVILLIMEILFIVIILIVLFMVLVWMLNVIGIVWVLVKFGMVCGIMGVFNWLWICILVGDMVCFWGEVFLILMLVIIGLVCLGEGVCIGIVCGGLMIGFGGLLFVLGCFGLMLVCFGVFWGLFLGSGLVLIVIILVFVGVGVFNCFISLLNVILILVFEIDVLIVFGIIVLICKIFVSKIWNILIFVS